MAVPATLGEWREFVARSPKRPDILTVRQIKSLPDAARRDYDDARMRWLNADIVLETPDVRQLRRLWAVLRAEAMSDGVALSRMLAISGGPTYGKSTAVMWLARAYERNQRQRYPALAADEFQPAIYVVTPAATTPKMLMIAFCNTLGLPHASGQTAQDLSEHVIQVLKTLGTTLVALDEIHNVQSNRQAGAEAASTLKLFAERLDAAFLLTGIDLPRSPVFAGQVGEQLARRVMRYDMVGYTDRSAEGRSQWNTLIATFIDLLPLARQTEGLLQPASGFLFDATDGSIGRLRSLMRRAAIDAILSGRERIDTSDLRRFATVTGVQLPPVRELQKPRAAENVSA